MRALFFVVRSLQIDYLRPALFNELLQVSATVIDSKKASFTFSQHINRGDELLCTGIVRIACLDAHTLRPKAIPDLSLLHLIQEASFVVQFVMVLLLIASLASWTFIFSKRKELNRAIEITDEFEEQFWSGMALTELYRKLAAKDFKPEGIEKIFLAGYKEFSRMRQSGTIEPAVQVESAQRAMRIELSRELDRLDEHLSFLATVGSTSPYIGLFGTVWGIMNSFMSLGNTKQATLAQVAPGIAEALIATAIGLFAAIPAVIAYNRFSTRLDRLTGRYELFVEEFVVLLQRQAHSK